MNEKRLYTYSEAKKLDINNITHEKIKLNTEIKKYVKK